MSAKQTLSKLLSEGEFEKTLHGLETVFQAADDGAKQQEVVLLRSRYNQILSEERRGTISSEEVRREKNRISAALLELIGQVPASAILPGIMAGKESDMHQPASGAAGPAVSHRHDSRIPLFTGIGLLLTVLLLIILFPCPFPQQFFVTRVFLALGAASLSYYLSGALELNLAQGIKAGGAMGVLALIYLLNPADGMIGRNCDGEKSVTVFVHGDKGCTDAVLKGQGHVAMRIAGSGETKKEAINDKGEAKFSGLRAGQKVYLEVDFSEPYRAVNPDSSYIISEEGGICFEVALQNLDKVFGQTIFNDQPLAGVIVSIGAGLRDTTDDLGHYDLHIPKAMQSKEPEVSFFKPGFKMLTKTAHPQTNAPLNVIMAK